MNYDHHTKLSLKTILKNIDNKSKYKRKFAWLPTRIFYDKAIWLDWYEWKICEIGGRHGSYISFKYKMKEWIDYYTLNGG